MKELRNKPQTKSGGETTNKNNLPFSNTSIEKYIPTFGNLRYKSIPFKVPLKSHLKGLKLTMSKATKKKYFVLWYWFKGRYHPYTLGTYAPGFGVKEVNKKLFDIVEEHTNDKGLWIKDPKITKKDDETKITKSQFKNSQRKTVRETIELLCKAGFPRQEMGGSLTSRTIANVVRPLIGYNWRTAHLRYRDKNDGTGYVEFRINKVYSKKNKLTQVVKDWDGLFNKFPPGDPKYFIKDKAKTRNPLGMVSLYDDDQFGKLLMEDFTEGAIKRFLDKFKGYGSKINVIYALNVLWTFAKDTGLLGDKPGACPVKEVPNKKPPITQKTPGTDRTFRRPELIKIYNASFEVFDIYPFQAELHLLQMFCGRRQPELRKIREEQIDYINRLIHIPAHTHKIRKVDQFITITAPVAQILERLKRKKQDPRYEKIKDVPWIFPGFRWPKSKRHDYEFINSEMTMMKTTHHCWEAVRKISGVEGTQNMFRKTYTTLGKDEAKLTSEEMIRLTGHLDESTLDRYYYKSHKEVIQKDADKVALLFDFAQYKRTG
jgi:integrase